MRIRIVNILLVIIIIASIFLRFNGILQSFSDALGWHLSTTGETLVAKKIRYWAPAVGEVFFVWGINGWQTAPKEMRPPGTVLKDTVMYTPMTWNGDTFSVMLTALPGTNIDYGFLVTKWRNGLPASQWEADGEQDFRTIVTQGADIEIHSKLPRVDGIVDNDNDNGTSTENGAFSYASMAEVLTTIQAYRQRYQISDSTVVIVLAIFGIIVVGSAVFLQVKRSRARQQAPSAPTPRWAYLYDLLRELVGREMKLRYRRSVLGVAWSLLNPILQLLVFSFVFRYVLRLGAANYTIFLFSGLLVWNWLQGSLLGATTAIVDGSNLIKRPGFPAAILPVVTVSSNLIHFLLALPVLAFFLLQSGVEPAFTLLWLPVVIALQFIFTLSLVYFLATIHVSFRDTQYLVGVLLLLFFYLTPIFYDASIIPARFQAIYRLNPVFHLVEAYRSILLWGEAPQMAPLMNLAVVSIVLLLLGYQVFRSASYRFVEEL